DVTDGYATWAVLLLPYIEQDSIYRLWDLQKPASKQVPAAYQQQVSTYLCPSRPAALLSTNDFPQNSGGQTSGAGLGDYLPNFGTVNGVNNVKRNDGPVIEAMQTVNNSVSPPLVTSWRGRPTLLAA